MSWLRAALLSLCLACSGSEPEPAPLPPLPEPVVAPEPARVESLPRRELTLVLTGELRGEIEPCGCPTLPYGGFVRRERLLKTLKAEPAPLFQLDAGEAMIKGIVSDRGPGVETRAALIASLMIGLGVDLMAPGPSDLRGLGLEGLRALPGQGLKLVSATWTLPDGSLAFPPAQLLVRDGVRLGVVGLSAPPGEGSGLGFKEPVLAAREALATLPPDLDLVVLLSNLSESQVQQVVKEVPGFAMVLRGKGPALDPPQEGQGPLIVESPDRGRYLTVMHLTLAGPATLAPSPAASALWRDVLRLRERVTRVGQAGAAVELQAGLAQRVQLLEEQTDGLNLVMIEERPLGSELDGEAKASVALEAWRKAQLGAAAQGIKAEPQAGEARYVGSGACVRCHSLQAARWTYTAHAQATTALIEQGKQKDPECVECHSTGFGQPGGFADPSAVNLRAWGGVQCEACHGPLGGHPRDSAVQPKPVNEKTCLRCHDEANSPKFDYSTYLKKVVCPADPEVPAMGEGAPSTP